MSQAHASAPAHSNSAAEQADNFKSDLFKFLLPNDPNGARAKAVWADLSPHLEGILKDFYARLMETPPLATKLKDSKKSTDGLSRMQTAHWQRVFNSEDEKSIAEDARKIGTAHVRVGLTSDWFIAGYGRVLMDAVPALLKAHRFTPQRAAEATRILIARMFIDMAMANESYSSQMTDQEAIEWREDNDYQNLRTISDSIVDINKVSLNLAVVQDSTNRAMNSSESVAAAVEELVSSIEQLSNTSQQAAHSAAETNNRLNEGVQGVMQARSAISTVSDAAERSNESLSSLQEAAGEINAVMGVIQSIADQTNLLALNATIEAARAGEAGRGFAVVASEVKALANQTASATEDVASRIQTLQSEIDRISSNFNATREAIETGETTLNSASEHIQTAGSQMDSVASSMSEVAQILEQQKGSAGEISGHVSGMAELAKENANCLDEISDAMQIGNDRMSQSASHWFRGTSGRFLCEMAKIDHVLFNKRVVDTVLGRGKWKSNEVPDHHNCRLGKWYDQVSDPTLTNLDLFKSLREPHQQVHQAATKALKAKEAGRSEEAIAALRDLDNASKKVVEILVKVSEHLHSQESISERRKRDRKPVYGEKVEIKNGSGAKTAQVIDEGKGGIGVEGLATSDVGQMLELYYNGPKKGVVRWASGKRGGIEFKD
ncbi:MAG: hypothetical protein CMK09_07735 [Ponticaulis sp.]|nr:hypothetical protein [Ponticaulis sp.]|tara:strand:+ start:45965 stop:47956 length:1992 start_codon:yes stop_codon:yes gene_type:complete